MDNALETPRPRISVALAAKDGERFFAKQLRSILPQLEAQDELVISVDASSDATLEIAQGVAQKCAALGLPAPIVLIGPNRGVAANFEHALQACTGEIIFLADQDDVWMPDKVSTVLAAFANSDVLLVCHDACMTDENLNVVRPSYFAWRKSRSGLLRNIIRNSFVGCCMAFRRELLDTALPFPASIPMHDQWLGLVAERSKQGRVVFLDKPLVQYRRHDTNSSPSKRAGAAQMLKWRLDVLRSLLSR